VRKCVTGRSIDTNQAAKKGIIHEAGNEVWEKRGEEWGGTENHDLVRKKDITRRRAQEKKKKKRVNNSAEKKGREAVLKSRDIGRRDQKTEKWPFSRKDSGAPCWERGKIKKE